LHFLLLQNCAQAEDNKITMEHNENGNKTQSLVGKHGFTTACKESFEECSEIFSALISEVNANGKGNKEYAKGKIRRKECNKLFWKPIKGMPHAFLTLSLT
jgi:hypothetical protein